MKYILTLLMFFLYLQATSQTASIKLYNSSDKNIGFIKYDEFGNYQHFALAPGKTIEISFQHEYLNIFARENDRNVPYFFFDGDDIEITEVNNKYYKFECNNSHRKNELQLAAIIFESFQNDSLTGIETSDLLQQTASKIDSIISSFPSESVSLKFKQLIHLFYKYEMLEKKFKYNAGHNIKEPFEQYWQQGFNNNLQSYITSFRSYVLNYLPKFLKKDALLNDFNNRFEKEYKEIAMYTYMHMAYYRNREWFRNHYDEYINLSNDSIFSERLSIFKLTDDISNKSTEIFLINTAKDTISLENLLAKFKGKVILIDLWASWCTPCLESFPYTNDLVNSFDANLFQVLYLSLDREFHLFSQYAIKNLKGKHTYNIIGDFNSSFAKINKITSIPRYMIIDKQGKIASASAPSPTNKQLKIMIENLF